MQEINTLLEKYNNFRGAQIRSVEYISKTERIVTLGDEDEDGEDMYSVKLTFSDIQSSKILEQSVLSYLDMSSGITLIKENGLYGFAIGKGSAMLHVHNAPIYIVAAKIKID
ncbi:MAG: hypothetical protein COA39_005160 [Sulfurimonas sp.]|nr:hypothetical protein [Sulfurimonas sp.]